MCFKYLVILTLMAGFFLSQMTLALVPVDKALYFSFEEKALTEGQIGEPVRSHSPWAQNLALIEGQIGEPISCLSYNQQTNTLDFCDETHQVLVQQLLDFLSQDFLSQPDFNTALKKEFSESALLYTGPFDPGLIKSQGIEVADVGGVCARSNRPGLQKGIIILSAGLLTGLVAAFIGGAVAGIGVTLGTGLVTGVILVGTADSINKPGYIEKEIGKLIGISSILNFICSG